MATVVLKRVVMMAFIVLFGEILVFGGCAAMDGSAYAASEEPASVTVPKMAVMDVAYKTPVGVGITPIKATPEAIAELEEAAAAASTEESGEEVMSEETEGNWQTEDAEIRVEGNVVYVGDDDYYIINPNIAPYNGGDYYDANMSGAWYEGSAFAFDGTYDDASGLSFTYYSQNVLSGGGLNIPGRHVGDEGYVCDENGYVCLASDNLLRHTVVSIPFGCGTGVVYDKGSGDGNIDVYVSW